MIRSEDWETLDDAGIVERLSVPGGWIYVINPTDLEVAEKGKANVSSSVFVPDPELYCKQLSLVSEDIVTAICNLTEAIKELKT